MGQYAENREIDHHGYCKLRPRDEEPAPLTDMSGRGSKTKLLQEALAGCGWEDAANIHQHDVSEAFTFITEQLELPRLTLKMDIYHTGKEDAADDHKLINERLLQVGIPSEPTDGKVITLEDCLENYFNNRIEVRRHLERKGTISSMRSLDSMKGQLIHVESVESRSPPASPSVQLPNPLVTGLGSPSHTGFRTRSPSIIRDRVFTSENDITQFHQNGYTESRQGSQRQNSMRKEVLMPAWQFFSLMRTSRIIVTSFGSATFDWLTRL